MNSDFKYSINITDEDRAKQVRVWFINEYVRKILDKQFPNIYEEAVSEFERFIKTCPAEDQQVLNLALDRKDS